MEITGGNGEEMEGESMSEGKAIELISGGMNGGGVRADCLVEKVSDLSKIRHVNESYSSQSRNPSFSQTSWREGNVTQHIYHDFFGGKYIFQAL